MTRMRVVGGDLALDLINTRSGPPVGDPDDEALHGYDDLVTWALHVGALSDREAAGLRRHIRGDAAGADAVFRRALRVRDDLDDVFRALATGRRPSAQHLSRLRDDEVDALGHAELVERTGGFAWCWEGDRGPARPLWPVIHAATELLRTGPLDRIKGCAGCRFLFIDESKNRSRRWCSMDDCGATEKMRRYVARRAARSH